jgi:tRNA threonylcarbamoyladenosine biosynthesis protein TsaE
MSDEFQNVAKHLKKKIGAKTILLLSGELGAGKTQFAKTLVQVLHGRDKVFSPTYALHHHYAGTPDVEHWDLYRLDNEDDLESSGFWDQFSSPALIIIEWPERLKIEWLPNDWQLIKVHIQVNGDARTITWL